MTQGRSACSEPGSGRGRRDKGGGLPQGDARDFPEETVVIAERAEMREIRCHGHERKRLPVTGPLPGRDAPLARLPVVPLFAERRAASATVAISLMVVDHADCLHERVADGRADELAAVTLEPFAEGV